MIDDDPLTELNERTQRRKWHEEDLQRLQRALVRVQAYIAGASFLVLLLVAVAFWSFSRPVFSDLWEVLAAQVEANAATAEQVRKLSQEAARVGQVEDLGEKVKEAQWDVMNMKTELQSVQKQFAEKITREAEGRERLMQMMTLLHERLKER